MVHAPPSVWDSFAARKNSKHALHWQDRSFPYFDALAPLYDGRHAEGRTCHGMDHYASKAKNTPVPSTQAALVDDTYQSPSPPINTPAASQSGLQFPFDDEALDEANLDFSQHFSTPVQQTPAAPSSKRVSAQVSEWCSTTPVQHTTGPPSCTRISGMGSDCRRAKKQKNKSTSSEDGFHERYLKLKREEIDRFPELLLLRRRN